MNRQSKGTPVGGQFAQDRKPEGGDIFTGISQDRGFEILREMGANDDDVYRFLEEVGDRDRYEREDVEEWWAARSGRVAEVDSSGTAYLVHPDGRREWSKNGEPVPPPIGTEISPSEARALPSYTEVMVTFDTTPDREFRLMARDLPRWTFLGVGAGSDRETRDSHLPRRFTNLDTGFEVFLGGDEGMNSVESTVNMTKIRVSGHG
jgi:hypothetical protein